jgi:rubrerythrin
MVSPDDTPQCRSMRGRIGAYESWARTDDRAARTWPARKAALDRFEREVDPDGVLTPEERAKRAEWARKAHMQRLALKSAAARQRRKLICQTCGKPKDAAAPLCPKCFNKIREP